MEIKPALPHRHNLYQRHPFIKTTSTGTAHRLHQAQGIQIGGHQYDLDCDAIIYLCLLVLDRMSASHRFIGVLGEKLSRQVREVKAAKKSSSSIELTDINKMQMQASETDCSTLTQLFYTLLSSFKNMLMTTGRPA